MSAPEPLTPEGKLRYADGVVDARRGRIIAVQEDHSGSGEAVNTVAAICARILWPASPLCDVTLWRAGGKLGCAAKLCHGARLSSPVL